MWILRRHIIWKMLIAWIKKWRLIFRKRLIGERIKKFIYWEEEISWIYGLNRKRIINIKGIMFVFKERKRFNEFRNKR